MIRRALSMRTGERAWLLISQIEHARLAGTLASEWGRPPFPAVEPRDELLPAIFRHDDGWADWERQPQVEPVSGQPRDFMEMPVEQSLLIWRTSIERAAAMSLLGGAAIAGHFLHLLRHAEVWQQHGSRAAAAAHQWAAEFESLRAQWLDEWSSRRPVENTPAVAAAALQWLQFFDRLSLWICMSSEARSDEMSTCDGPSVRLDSRQTAEQAEQTVVLGPWPLRVPALEISLSGRLIRQRRYADAADLSAEGQLVVWRLCVLPR